MIIRILPLFITTFALFSFSAQAQNKIIIIGDDGKKQELIINQDPVVAPKKEPAIIAPEPTLSAEDLITPQNLDLPPVESVKPKEAAAPKPKVKVAVPTRKQEQKKQRPVSQKPKLKLPMPKVKPNKEEIEKAINAKPLVDHIDPANIPEGTPITRALATRAALEVAPPSTGYVVDGIIYKERPSFRVSFKTEWGIHDVVIDGYTGEVLKK